MEKQKLSNATAVLVLGILSILGCCCYGIFGIVLGIIALVLAKKDFKIYKENSELYSNYSTLNTGKILAIIGIAFSTIMLFVMIVMLVTFGWEGLNNSEIMQEKLREFSGQ